MKQHPYAPILFAVVCLHYIFTAAMASNLATWRAAALICAVLISAVVVFMMWEGDK